MLRRSGFFNRRPTQVGLELSGARRRDLKLSIEILAAQPIRQTIFGTRLRSVRLKNRDVRRWGPQVIADHVTLRVEVNRAGGIRRFGVDDEKIVVARASVGTFVIFG